MTKDSIKKLKDTRKKLYDLRDKLETAVIEDIKQCSCTLNIDSNCIVFEDSADDKTGFSSVSVVVDGNERTENVISALDAMDVALAFLDAALCDM